MTEPQDAGVRQTAPPFAQRTPPWPTIREVGAPLLHRTCLQSRNISVEWLQRFGSGPVAWRFRQDRHALFLFERGVTSCRGTVDGCRIGAPLYGAARLAFVPAGAAVEATFDVPARCSYFVAFFDASPLLDWDEEMAGLGVPGPQIGFAQPRLALAVTQLRQEMTHQDGVSRLMAEGFAAQAWALLHRRLAVASNGPRALRPAVLRTVLNHMRERIADDVSVTELAALAGLGARQFCRRFHAATGATPARARDSMRLDLATTLLTTTRRSVTDVALDCGFSQPQHLATAIKRRCGLTPSELRGDSSAGRRRWCRN